MTKQTDEKAEEILGRMATYLLAKFECDLVLGEGAWERLTHKEREPFKQVVNVRVRKTLDGISAKEPVMNWQPIETAPKDGRPILGREIRDDNKNYLCCRVVIWDDEFEEWIDPWESVGLQASFWVPIPSWENKAP